MNDYYDKKIHYVRLADQKIEPLSQDLKYNVFFIGILPTKLINELYISVFKKKNSIFISEFINFKFLKIYEENKNKNYQFIIQVQMKGKTDKISIKFKKASDDFDIQSIIKINHDINNFFYLDNLEYDSIDNFSKLKKNDIIDLYLNYIFEPKNNVNQKIKADLINSIFYNISSNYEKETDINFIIVNIENKEEINKFKKLLLSLAKDKKTVNEILMIKSNLTDCLQYLTENMKYICDILEKNSSFFDDDKNNYELTFQRPEVNDDVPKCIINIYKIFNEAKHKNYQILDYYKNLKNLIEYQSNKSLNELCDLKKYLLMENLGKDIMEYYYNKIHKKGLGLIENGKLEPKEIIHFIINQDVFYSLKEYENSPKREPKIFKYIPITNKNNNYKEYIKLIKDENLWNIFSNSKPEMKIEFYSILLNQMENIIDFKSIFDIFNYKFITEEFARLITNKIDNLKYTILNEEKENYKIIFDILDKWIICILQNGYSSISDEKIANIIEMNYIFPSQYYMHLLQTQKMKDSAKKLQDKIITYFIKLFLLNEDINIVKIIIKLLLNSIDNEFLLCALDKLEPFVLNETDFYNIEDNKIFLLFKSFFEECRDIIDNNDIVAKGKFLYQSKSIKKKILKNLEENNILYFMTRNLIDENDSFYKKILVIIDNENKAKEIYENFKKNIQKCDRLLKYKSKIENYYLYFFKSSKSDLINLMQADFNGYEILSISEIFQKFSDLHKSLCISCQQCNSKFIDIESCECFQNIAKQSENIKYMNSSFFKAIYQFEIKNNCDKNTSPLCSNHSDKNKINFETPENSDFNEEIALVNSIKNYKDTLEQIIKLKGCEKYLFKIKNIDIIINELLNKKIDIEKEINFIKEEFSYLHQGDYIQNKLIKDLLYFSKQYEIVELFNGIIKFIEINNDMNQNNTPNIFIILKKIYYLIISKQIKEAEVKKMIIFLKENEHYTNNEHFLFKWVKSLLGKKESLIFIKEIVDLIVNRNNISSYNEQEIDELINIYTFFIKIISDQNIINDTSFYNECRNELKNNENFAKNINKFINKYINFVNTNEKKFDELFEEFINDRHKFENIIEINFDYNEIQMKVNLEKKIGDIFSQFYKETSCELNSFLFYYNHKQLVNNELILSDIITQEDKKNRKMKILVKQREPKSISNINNINEGQFLCENHYLINQYFCTECKKYLCENCEGEHINHKLLKNSEINLDINNIELKLEKMRKEIDKININIIAIIYQLNQFKKNLEKCFSSYEKNIKDLIANKKYDEILYYHQFNEKLNKINKEKNIYIQFENMMKTNDFIKDENQDEITLIYKIKKDEKSIKLFGNNFVINNKDCNIIIGNKEYKLQEKLDIDLIKDEIINNEILIIKLLGIDKVKVAADMFHNCYCLRKIIESSKFEITADEVMVFN